jgi:hypothetical protein
MSPMLTRGSEMAKRDRGIEKRGETSGRSFWIRNDLRREEFLTCKQSCYSCDMLPCRKFSSNVCREIPMNAKKICIVFFTCFFLIIFSIGGVFVIRQIERRNGRIDATNDKVMVVVAKHDYPKGTIITDPEEMFEVREFLEADAPHGTFYFSEVGQVGPPAILTEDIHEGQPLLNRSGESLTFAGLIKVGKLEPPGPGREYFQIMTPQARQDSIRVGARVDVFEWESKDEHKGESKILMQNALVRAVLPVRSSFQKRLNKNGKTNLVAVNVVVDVSAEELRAFLASVNPQSFMDLFDFFEVRPSVDTKKVDKKNSGKTQ